MYARLEGEISDLKSHWESDIAARSRENVARDVELNTLRDSDVTLRAELLQRKHDVDRYIFWLHTSPVCLHLYSKGRFPLPEFTAQVAFFDTRVPS